MHQTHVQEGGGVTTYGEKIGGGFGGAVQYPPEAREHISPVRHEEGGHEEAQAEVGKEQLQERVF